MLTDKNSFVPQSELKRFDEIDGFKVIEDLLLFKGEDIAGANRCVSAKHLDDMALITYGLKVNATNKLYVGMALDRFYHRTGLRMSSGKVKVPSEIYDRVKILNDQYRTEANKDLE